MTERSEATDVAVAEPNSTDEQAHRGLQPAGELPLPVSRVMNVARRGEVERFEQAVVLPEVYQYQISRYGSEPKVMLTSDGYDYLNRTMGVSLPA